MIMNGLLPPKILPGHDTKPWEIKALDTKELWQYGGYGSIASLELMCVCMGVESSKNMEVTGNKVHEAYWVNKDIKGIVEYCEKDVLVLIDVIKKNYNISMKVLVTGSNGLVGSPFKELLGDGHIYHTRQDVDLTDEKLTKEYIAYHVKNSGVDTIINCAAKVGGVQANIMDNENFFYKII